MAARSVQLPEPSSQTPSPGIASTASKTESTSKLAAEVRVGERVDVGVTVDAGKSETKVDVGEGVRTIVGEGVRTIVGDDTLESGVAVDASEPPQATAMIAMVVNVVRSPNPIRMTVIIESGYCWGQHHTLVHFI